MGGRQGAKASAGVVYSAGSSKQLPKDLLTWHDQLPYRIWIHSRKGDSGFKTVAVNVQWIGNEHLPVSETEKKLRINLATVVNSVEEESQLGPTSFRNLALGRFLEEHARLIASQKTLQQARGNRRVNIVRDFEFQDFPDGGIEIKMHRRAGGKKLELGANKNDSLFISYIYAEQCANGSKMPASLTAELLGIDKDLVYVAVRTARKYGWLTKSKSGSAKGEMTSEGLKAFRAGAAKSLYEEFFNKLGK
jgi:hypothetical protein